MLGELKRDDLFKRIGGDCGLSVSLTGTTKTEPNPIADEGYSELRKLSGTIRGKNYIVQDIVLYAHGTFGAPNEVDGVRGISFNKTRFFIDGTQILRSPNPDMDVEASEKEIRKFLELM